jgi:Winged helix DNA-binding domain
VLTQRERNRALLARQLLLERVRAPLPRVLERMAGIQAQYAPSMYIGLWSRVDGFERDALTRALERRSVVQATLMRSTIHLVSRRDFWPFALGTRDARRQWWRRVHRDGPAPRDIPRSPLPRSFRPGAGRRHRELVGGCSADRRRCRREAAAAPFPRRGRR